MKEKFGFEQSKKGKEEFNFTAKEVLADLKSPKNKIEYIGSATSHWQAEPVTFDNEGNKIKVSDWDMLVIKNIEGDVSKIKTGKPTEISELPSFLPKEEEYINRSAELGENTFRFSLDFPRLCPKEGEFNSELMADYVKALALIRARGQEPLLCIYHWPMPRYLLEFDGSGGIKKGGWENPEVNKHFRHYVENVTKFLADDDKVRKSLEEVGFDKKNQDKVLANGLVNNFISINEPTSILGAGYVGGNFPPFRKGRIDLIKKVTGALVEAHDITREQLKEKLFKINPQVGVAHAWPYFDKLLGDLGQSFLNETTTNAFERNGDYSDFLGLQYYFRVTLPFIPGTIKLPGRTYSDQPAFGDIYPRGIYENLKLMHDKYPQKNIFICEFGFADKDDKRRPYWILETMRYILEAKKAGIPIKGMLLWSLVNNFEWDFGMTQKFGLFSESELSKPLKSSKGDMLRSWEAWKAAVKAIKDPSAESLQELQSYYEKAKKQFDEETSKPKVKPPKEEGIKIISK